MTSNYNKLKRAILLRTAFVAILALIIGEGIVHFFIDGVFQDLFTEVMMRFFTQMSMDPQKADYLYGRIFMDHKMIFLGIGYFVLFLLFYNFQVKRMLHYLQNVEVAIDSIRDEAEDPVTLVPELKPLEDKLESVKMNLRKKDAMRAMEEQRKNDLVVYLAHDLKTPLTSVIAYLTMLDGQKTMPEEDRVKYTHITLEKATRLGELINEFFEITRFNLQDIVLNKEELNLSFMLEQLADESYGVLGAKYLTCSVDAEEDLIVEGDPDKLARVFDNLLRNAIAYSYTDTEIRIEAEKKDSEIEIRFRNQGHQIPEQKLETIFEKFYRVDHARSSKTGGAGLGLSIAKRIVELHGGRISAASDWNYTTFTVCLPMKEDKRPLLVESAAKSKNKRDSKKELKKEKAKDTQRERIRFVRKR